MTRPREFWILGYDHINHSSLAYEDISKCPHMKENMIHCREVVLPEAAPDACDIIIELQHQRSIAFDEARKYRMACDVMREAIIRTIKGTAMHHKEFEDDGRFVFTILNEALTKAQALIGGQDET